MTKLETESRKRFEKRKKLKRAERERIKSYETETKKNIVPVRNAVTGNLPYPWQVAALISLIADVT